MMIMLCERSACSRAAPASNINLRVTWTVESAIGSRRIRTSSKVTCSRQPTCWKYFSVFSTVLGSSAAQLLRTVEKTEKCFQQVSGQRYSSIYLYIRLVVRRSPSDQIADSTVLLLLLRRAEGSIACRIRKTKHQNMYTRDAMVASNAACQGRGWRRGSMGAHQLKDRRPAGVWKGTSAQKYTCGYMRKPILLRYPIRIRGGRNTQARQLGAITMLQRHARARSLRDAG